jgi:hypothetical protein
MSGSIKNSYWSRLQWLAQKAKVIKFPLECKDTPEVNAWPGMARVSRFWVPVQAKLERGFASESRRSRGFNGKRFFIQ